MPMTTATFQHVPGPSRMVARTMVRFCLCGNPWPCLRGWEARWNQLRDRLTGERTIIHDHACDLSDEAKAGAERAFAKVEALDEVLTEMKRMEEQ